MKLKTQLLLLGAVLFFIILIVLYAGTGPVPYSKDTLFSIQYPYEGFQEGAVDGEVKKTNEVTPSIASALEKVGVKLDSVKPSEKKVEGFSGLLSAPYGDEKSLDMFSQLSSGKSCTPSPYSNSQGYLCLDGNASKMLQTRGGNATGGDAQIGH
jgi:hypothetical protein